MSTLTAVALIGGVLAIAAPAAHATAPGNGQLFNPASETIGAGLATTNVLSDRADGTDSTAHLTAVGTDDTTQVIFVNCPPGQFPANGPVPPNGCETIGTDSTPTAPENDSGTNGDEAYDFNWDIPSTFDDTTRDIGAYICQGDPTATEGTAPPASTDNCLLDTSLGVAVDDSSSGTTASSSAELGTICTADLTAVPPACTGTAMPLSHGASIPKNQGTDGYLITATSSSDVSTLRLCIDTSDANDPPNACTIDQTDAGTGSGTRSYQFEIGNIPVSEDAFTLYDDAIGGSGACGAAAICELDSHYGVVSQIAGGSVVESFAGGFPPASCDAPDTAPRENNIGDSEAVFGCILDGSGNLTSADWTFEFTGTRPAGSGFSSCSGTGKDFDGDGFDDACTGTGPVGNASVIGTSEPGTLDITFCADDENNQFPLGPTVERFGCADEPSNLVAHLTKTYVAGTPNQVSLVFDDGDSDPCAGDLFREIKKGETTDLIACVYDSAGNLTSTTRVGDGGDLQWDIQQGADDQTDTSFVTPPPQDDDGTGVAVATMQGNSQGTDDINVTLRDENGGFVDSDEVQLQVKGKLKKKFASTVTIRDSFKGQVQNTKSKCQKKRKVILQKKKHGDWTKVGSDKTNKDGNWKVHKDNPNGKYRAKAKKKTYVNNNSVTIVCKSDKSPTIVK